MNNIRPYSFMISKTNRIKFLDKFKLFILRLLLPSDFYIGEINSKSYIKFVDKVNKRDNKQ